MNNSETLKKERFRGSLILKSLVISIIGIALFYFENLGNLIPLSEMIGVVLIGIGIISIAYILLKASTSGITITTKEIIIHDGFFLFSSPNKILHNRIENVRPMKKKIWGFIFGFGDIEVLTNGNNKYPVSFVSNSTKFADFANKVINGEYNSKNLEEEKEIKPFSSINVTGKSTKLYDDSIDTVWRNLLSRLGLTEESNEIDNMPGFQLKRKEEYKKEDGKIDVQSVEYFGNWNSGGGLKAKVTKFSEYDRTCNLSLINKDNEITRVYEFRVYSDSGNRTAKELIVREYLGFGLFSALCFFLSPLVYKNIASDAN